MEVEEKIEPASPESIELITERLIINYKSPNRRIFQIENKEAKRPTAII